MVGGYDEGYAACPCFWGREPGSHVQWLYSHLGSLAGMRVLDLGCGEGKNAVFCARRGATVTAIDVSSKALINAKKIWNSDDYDGVTWIQHNAIEYSFTSEPFDLVIMYGLLHCLPDFKSVESLVVRAQQSTAKGGYNIVCAFNDRKQDLSAHPEFSPCLLRHDAYSRMYESWETLRSSDTDLFETHPHNNIPHSHSLTRIVSRRPK